MSEPHRDWAIDAVQSFPGARVIFEAGCHCGPLLLRLEAAGYEAIGIDVNAGAVHVAQDDGLTAFVGDVATDRSEAGRFCDVAVSSYCLAYIDPKDLAVVLAGLISSARLGVVVVEPMAGPGVVEAQRSGGGLSEWRHDYLNAFECAQMLVPERPLLQLTRTRKGPHGDLNGVVVARMTWPN